MTLDRPYTCAIANHRAPMIVSELRISPDHPKFKTWSTAVDATLISPAVNELHVQRNIVDDIIALAYADDEISTYITHGDDPHVGIVCHGMDRVGISTRFNTDDRFFAGCTTVNEAADRVFALICQAHEQLVG